MSNMPNNPNKADHKTSATDTSIVASLSGGGATYMNPAETPTVLGNSHPVAVRGDGALWDITSSAYVSIHTTTIGTTLCPKNGQ